MSHRLPRLECLVLLALVLAGCGSPAGGTAAGAPRRASGAPAVSPDSTGTLTEPTCSDGAACAAGFMLDGVFHSTSCGAVRPDMVSDRVIATGTYMRKRTEVRQIDGVDPSLVVALLHPGGACGEGDSHYLSRWSMAFPQSEDNLKAERQRNLHLATCRVTPEQHQRRNRCPIDSPLSSPRVQAFVPLAAYSKADWPSTPNRLECERGMGRSNGVPADARRQSYATAVEALARAEREVVTSLSRTEAKATLTPSFRQMRPRKTGHEELFFRGDGTPVAWVSIDRTPNGSWHWTGYFTCRPTPAG